MANLREKVPGEFTDDERWYKFFTLRSLIAFLTGGLIDFLVTVTFRKAGLGMVGFITGTLLFLILFGLATLRWPQEDTVRGGGRITGNLLLTALFHRRNQNIYVRMFEEAEDD